MGLEVWFRVILSLGFSILFQQFWNWGLAVSQGLEFTILYTSFWLANSLLIVTFIFELLINLFDSIVCKIDAGQRFDISKLQNLKAGEVHIMRVPVETE